MIQGLKPYPAYKDSGVPWLGEVPAHWDVRRLRNSAEMRVSTVDKHAMDHELPVRLCNYVDVYKNDRIHPAMALMRATATKDEIARFRLAPGDVLITKDSESWSDIGVPAHVVESADDMVCGYHLALLRPFACIMIGSYLFRALQCNALAYQFHIEANGVTRYGLSHSAIKSVRLPVPPLPEQSSIARFLAHVDRKIQRAIRAKQRLIKLLEEEKQVLIHRAVTGQIDVRTGKPYPAYKPSGVEWLGDVPEHWEIVPLKRLAWFKSGAGFPVGEQGKLDAEIPFLRVSDMTRPGNELWVEAAESTVSRETAVRLKAYVFPAGTIIFPKVGGALLTNKRRLLRRPSSIDNNIMGCVPKTADDRYLLLLLQQIDLGRLSKPGPVPAIGEGDVREVRVALPPKEERDQIHARVERGTIRLDSAIKHEVAVISLLREYRARLIADVVTGKLDVREASARLPAEPEADVAATEPDEDLDLPQAAEEEGSYEEPEADPSE